MYTENVTVLSWLAILKRLVKQLSEVVYWASEREL